MSEAVHHPEQRPSTGLLFFAPFVSSRMRLQRDWIDYNGHLNMAYYQVLFDRAVDEAFGLCGLGPDYVAERNASFFLVESRIRYRRELKLEDAVRVTLRLLAHDDKRIHYAMELRHAADGWLAASCENISINVDLRPDAPRLSRRTSCRTSRRCAMHMPPCPARGSRRGRPHAQAAWRAELTSEARPASRRASARR